MLTTAPRTSITVFLSCWVCASSLFTSAPTFCRASVLVRYIDVDHAANLVVIDLGGRVDLMDIGHRPQR